ncbi:(Fe-S)-binding protein [Helicobacter mustelae]|uniref:Putative oxidoreductase iron-sulfur subunit n=1 Tax=Helicobacter mustelae (strain ATCC 43772 / CCUG 25715 / CIP 103759 / LMG 18044 / NCTC 12198 / R85-136P) TaxID=679897 RepID=D3UHT9_HELM1|nr:(Fe-S)-binding protein [Helicobacter mustelae]CBG40062.1 putative oxidoreductase iron-sulfur subunit [Helicobacter mustelae 12198]SQH71576.1 oxidoreductase iron-sulfur subunit [Helicobacter mustelae]STP12701.1 oxidoreductase iron-sulfur subunit [Helicobacter mustelae]
MKVYFFATCLGNIAYSSACVNAIKLLQHAGMEVIFKKDQTCCGQPSYNSGYFEESRRVALYNVELFSGDHPIVLPSGSCAGMMKHDYLELFEGHHEYERVKQFCSRVYEVSEFLDQKTELELKDKGEPIKITWHSNCHALRVAQCIPSAKKFLHQLENVTLIELEREEECCGFGGTFSVKEPEISNAMVQEKVADIQARQVDCLVAGDGGCLMNISGKMQKMGLNIKTMHLYDFLAQRAGI